jgi:uncharacterized protein DUF6934
VTTNMRFSFFSILPQCLVVILPSMNLERYTYYANPSFFDFEFLSEGPKGTIKKVARFNTIGVNLYNFGFGDLDETTGDISDTVVTNNGDGDKVLATVAGIVYDFTGRFTEAAIYIKGSTAARTRWYQMSIGANWEEIGRTFEVFGYRDDKWEHFQKGQITKHF